MVSTSKFLPVLVVALFSLTAHAMDNQESIITLHQFYENNDLDGFKNFVRENNADVNALNSHGKSVLHLAARFGQVDWIELLAELDADINKSDVGAGWIPSTWALRCGNLHAYRKLLSLGAKIDYPLLER